MQVQYIVFSLILVIILFSFFFLLHEIKKLRKNKDSDGLTNMIVQAFHGMNQRIDATSKTLNEQLDRSHSHMSQTLGSLSQLMGSVGKELGGVREIGTQISRFQEFLNSPKLRGNIGEHILYDSLSKMLPSECYRTQHKFRQGQVVDALIVTDNGHIPIDSKFPFDHFKRYAEAKDGENASIKTEFIRSVKKYVDDICSKYIIPEEGTVDFAVMYIPAEQAYYEILNDELGIMSYAREKKVLIVSPHTFFHLLRIILLGLEKTRFAKDAQKMWELMVGLRNDFKKFGKVIDVLGRHVTNAKSSVDTAQNEYLRIDSKLDNINQLK